MLDLSIMKPAPQNRLVDRLFSIRENDGRYRKIVEEIAATSFSRERLLEQLEAFNAATKEILRPRYQGSRGARRGGIGPPGQGLFGASPRCGEFIDKRLGVGRRAVGAKEPGVRAASVRIRSARRRWSGQPTARPRWTPLTRTRTAGSRSRGRFRDEAALR